MDATVIDHSPPVVNHTGLTAGLPWQLSWAFGPENSPDNLSGSVATVRIRGVPLECTVDGPAGKVTFAPSAAVTAAFRWQKSRYVLVLDGTVAVVGQLLIDQRVSP